MSDYHNQPSKETFCQLCGEKKIGMNHRCSHEQRVSHPNNTHAHDDNQSSTRSLQETDDFAYIDFMTK
jgi:hypothetical protein